MALVTATELGFKVGLLSLPPGSGLPTSILDGLLGP